MCRCCWHLGAPACKVSQAPPCPAAGGSWSPRGMWTLEGGMDMLVVGLLQGALSYAWFDPVPTGEVRVMVRSFVTGGIMAMLFIFLFSFVGIFGAMEAVLNPDSVPCDIYTGMLGGQPAAVAKYFGTAVFSVVNIIFLVSSCTVLDSTSASTSKLFGPELFGAILRGKPLPPQMATQTHAWAVRLAIVFMALVGTLPLIARPSALDATTISGTMVVGLGPPVFALTFLKGYRPLVFHLPFWTGITFGVMQLSSSPCCKGSMNITGFQIGNGTYKTLLGFNAVLAVCCWGLAALALLDNRSGRKLQGQDEEDYDVPDVHGKVPGVNTTSLLGLPVPAFLRGGGSRGRSSTHDTSNAGSKGTGAVSCKDAGVAGPPVASTAAAAGTEDEAAPAPAAAAAGEAGGTGATASDHVGGQ